MNLMVAYDGSAAGKKALSVARQHAKAFGANVYVVSCLEGDIERRLEEIATVEGYLNDARTFFIGEGVLCETQILTERGNPGENLIQFADRKDIDEIFVGIKKKSRVEKLVFGSNAQYVILEARCPVVTVK
jgi:nucleotide-binding universal stress UspA family protein